MSRGLIEFIVKNIIEHDRELFETSIDNYDTIASNVLRAIEHDSLNFNNMETITLNQNGKKRMVKKYPDKLSNENILCYYIKYILDKIFRTKYPNRNKTMKSLFDIFSAIIQMTDFTIIRFDFKNYFNTISSEYVFDKYIKYKISNRSDMYLIDKFVRETGYTYAGLCTSNAIVEIISKTFDDALFTCAKSHKMIFYQRYIDDGIIIFNEHLEEDEAKSILNNALQLIFFDKTIHAKECRTKFNFNKFQYVSRRNISQNTVPINFLGYEFYLFPSSPNKNLKRKLIIFYHIILIQHQSIIKI